MKKMVLQKKMPPKVEVEVESEEVTCPECGCKFSPDSEEESDEEMDD